MDDLTPRAQEAPLITTGASAINSATRTVSNSLIRNGSNNNNLMRASDLDLRQTKNELFSKLIERKQPQQMIVMPSGPAVGPTPNRTTSDENLNSSSLKKSTTNCSIADVDQQQQLATKHGLNQTSLSKSAATSLHPEAARQQFATLFTGKIEPASFSRQRSKWYTNEEVASILTSYLDHPEWQSNELQIRPKSGAVLLYSREKVRYRQDGYCWKKRKNGRTTREDHMKLKVQGVECIYGCYVHSALLPTFHRRCYWLLENPDIVLVHYLNQPPDDKKMILSFNSNLLELDTKRRWTNEEIVEEIGAVFGGISQIHRTLSINFPVASRVVASQSAVPLIPTRDDAASQAAAASVDRDFGTADRKAIDADDDENDEHQARDNEDEEMIVMNGECKSGPDRARRRRHSAGTSSSKTLGVGDSETNKPMIFDIVIDRRQQLEGDHNLGTNQQSLFNSSEPTSQDQQQLNHQNYQLVQKLVSKSSCAGQQVKSSSGEHANPCSPVTQIYNKIVDDIETYAIPFELNQFEPSHHHYHDSAGVQSMDTSEPTDQSRPLCTTEMTSRQLIRPQQQQQRHSYSAEPSLNPSTTRHQPDLGCNGSGVQQLIACDLFASCGHLPSDQNNNSANSDRANDGGDMLLAQFELGRTDGTGGDEHDNDETVEGDSQTREETDEMRDLMMDNAELPISDETNQASGLLLACQTDHSDPLESLFSFKPLMSDSLKADHHQNHNLLDVKSTTSETDTLLSRLSPSLASRQPPRCNSSDDAMQLSAQRLDQYLHHTSISFLAGAGPQDQMDAAFTIDGEQVNEAGGQHQLLMGAFEGFDDHHNMGGVGLSGEIQNSATSTEPSNSTSASSLLNVTGGGHAAGGGYLSNQSATEPGPSSSSTGSNYNEPNSTASSYIKLPLQQRQNSEQRESNNSLISSLLPKAFSLDGSDLSAVSNRNAKTSNQDHPQHHHHHHHHDHHLHHHNQHQYHQLHQRLSPLVGAYHHHGAARVATALGQSARSGGAYGQQPSAQMLMVPPSASSLGPHHHQSNHLNNRHHYQRPSAPSISTYSQDGMRKLAAATSCYTHPQSNAAPPQSQHQDLVECGTLEVQARLLPILDYVPNWSPSSGGIKVLLIGCWASLSGGSLDQSETGGQSRASAEDQAEFSQSGTYSILFDELVVPATLIQDNVLRCYSPQREPGFIALKVLYKNVIVSEQVLFEIRPTGCADQTSSTPSNTTTQTASSAATVAQLHDQTAA